MSDDLHNRVWCQFHEWTPADKEGRCSECVQEAGELANAIHRAERAEAERDRANALLAEARESWIKVGYGASHEDVAECRDFCDRIDAALAAGTKEGTC